MKKLALALAALVSSVALFAGPRAEAQIAIVPGWTFGTSISVSCMNSGSSQDVAKTPYLKNETGKTIPAGKTISWKASDGDSGSVKLAADLAPGATVKLQGTKPGNVYSCSAFFFTNPDLVPVKAQLASSSSVAISIINKDAFVGAGSSVAHVEVYSCSGTLLASADTAAFSMAAGETKSFTLPIKAVSGKTYLKVFADNGKKILESNESNNVLDTMNACIQ